MILNSITQKYLFMFVSIMFYSFLVSCTRDKVIPQETLCLETITYDQHIQLVLDNNCNASGCHNSNSANGDFTTFDKIENYFDGGSLYQRTINLKNMPPDENLSEAELEMFNCWIEGGYLKN